MKDVDDKSFEATLKNEYFVKDFFPFKFKTQRLW